MKPLLQKLILPRDHSFVAKTFRTPHFEVGWHRHAEYELILFTEGYGTSFVGNHVGTFETGDVYFLGSELPHTFQKHGSDLITAAVVVQFTSAFWGEAFLALPECRALRGLLYRSALGLKVNPVLAKKLAPVIIAMEAASGLARITRLSEALDALAKGKGHQVLSTQQMQLESSQDASRIDRVVAITIERYRENITLEEVAAIACLSVPAFCNFFKRSTKKTFIDFVSELRIGHACLLLRETNLPVVEVAYDSGYNTLANFHKQFFKLRQITPLQYRKQFAEQFLRPQANTGIVTAD